MEACVINAGREIRVSTPEAFGQRTEFDLIEEASGGVERA